MNYVLNFINFEKAVDLHMTIKKSGDSIEYLINSCI